jgi:predicted ATP pyrophosphatase (TIGR00289 family)
MNIPQLTAICNSEKTEDELSIISTLLLQAKEKFNIDGIVHGGIKSQFQKEKFESLCVELDLIALAPLWDTDPLQYMNELIDNNFNFIMTTVTSDGLDDTWLGKLISKSDIKILKGLSEKYKFNLNFEGGEAETFVLDCPLFSNPIIINQSKKIWDGYRGRFEIVDAGLDNNA